MTDRAPWLLLLIITLGLVGLAANAAPIEGGTSDDWSSCSCRSWSCP